MPTERLQVKFQRQPGGTISEDVAVITMHFQSQAAGLLDNTIRASVESAFNTFWTAAKTSLPPHTALIEYRWYDQQVYPILSPLLRATTVTANPGTGTSQPLPPQCSMSVTLMTNYRSRWGRFYMPGPTFPQLTANSGRYVTSWVDTIITAAGTFLQNSKTAGAYPKVWSPKGGKGPPQFFPGDVTSVIGVRGDDIVDIIRSRRWQSTPYHKDVVIN